MFNRRPAITDFVSRRSNLLVACALGTVGVLVVLLTLMVSGCGKSNVETSDAGSVDDAANYAANALGNFSEDIIPDADSLRTVRNANSTVVTRNEPQTLIAVIDVNEVGTSIGGLERINAMVAARERDLQNNFASLQQRFMKEYSNAATQIGNEPTQQEQADLLALQDRHMQQLTEKWKRNQQDVDDLHSSLKMDLLNSVRMVAAAVAKQKGIPTVLTRGQVFSVDDSSDITTEVTRQMKQILVESARNPAGTPVR